MHRFVVNKQDAGVAYDPGEVVEYEGKYVKVVAAVAIGSQDLRVTAVDMTECDECGSLHDMRGKVRVQCSCGSWVTK